MYCIYLVISFGTCVIVNEVIRAGKANGSRSFIPKPYQERSSIHHDKRDKSNNNLEKERTDFRVVNKMGVRDEFISGSPTCTKLHADTRGPRSVAQWAERRPQKISRTARRTNLVPVVSTTDETPPFDSPRQSKSKCDHTMSSSISESEESGATEYKIREKGQKCDELEINSGQNLQMMSNLVFPTRKKKLVNGEARNSGIRRKGRTGRGFGSARVSAPTMSEKVHNVGTTKQLRTSKHSNDKSESKLGRLPPRKLSDRKAYTHQKHTAVNTAPDFLVCSDDGHEDLLAAQHAVIS
ncbi:uncharacterized protein [Rutidosis leptorrhynchoides]|uniref:uncharacterized protein n=1 Tax=Rutidosis leptorrhynchoides TaxID=125765 RepID=UPI003A9A1F37